MTSKNTGVLVWCVAVLLAVPGVARADWLLSPFVGASFGGATDGEHVTYGGSLGYMGARVIGFEIDFGHTPELLNDDDLFVDDSKVTTLMVNLILGVPIGTERGARPYVSGGAGLLRTSVDGVDEFFDVDDNSFGMNVGAGVHVFLTDNVGFKVDARYFRSLEDADDGSDFDLDLGNFDFWRGTLGVSFRF